MPPGWPPVRPERLLRGHPGQCGCPLEGLKANAAHVAAEAAPCLQYGVGLACSETCEGVRRILPEPALEGRILEALLNHVAGCIATGKRDTEFIGPGAAGGVGEVLRVYRVPGHGLEPGREIRAYLVRVYPGAGQHLATFVGYSAIGDHGRAPEKPREERFEQRSREFKRAACQRRDGRSL